MLADETENAHKRDRFDAILSSTRDGLVVTDETGIVTSINASACSMLNVACEQVVGKKATIDTLLGADDPDARPARDRRGRGDRTRDRDLGNPSVTSSTCARTRSRLARQPARPVVTMRDITAEREIGR